MFILNQKSDRWHIFFVDTKILVRYNRKVKSCRVAEVVSIYGVLYFYIIVFVILIFSTTRPRNHKFMLTLQKKRKGVKRKMPTEMLKEFIGKDCTITLFNDIGGAQGKILSIEENWIKFEEKKRIRIINGDMIRDISVTK